ncbi:hypothetical protein VNO78_08682 [Psophocarpus tetragonolobus]|uniref:Uncharacterized protein n=1 Tax=Psophocarpus tetragonolobus TaxID=3891 RepID=A0AAN9SWT1_PSOTE
MVLKYTLNGRSETLGCPRKCHGAHVSSHLFEQGRELSGQRSWSTSHLLPKELGWLLLKLPKLLAVRDRLLEYIYAPEASGRFELTLHNIYANALGKAILHG